MFDNPFSVTNFTKKRTMSEPFLNSLYYIYAENEIKIHFYGWFIKISVGSLSLDCVVIDSAIHLRVIAFEMSPKTTNKKPMNRHWL